MTREHPEDITNITVSWTRRDGATTSKSFDRATDALLFLDHEDPPFEATVPTIINPTAEPITMIDPVPELNLMTDGRLPPVDVRLITDEQMAEAMWNSDDWPNRLGCTFENLRLQAVGKHIPDHLKTEALQEEWVKKSHATYTRHILKARRLRRYLILLMTNELPPQQEWDPYGRKPHIPDGGDVW